MALAWDWPLARNLDPTKLFLERNIINCGQAAVTFHNILGFQDDRTCQCRAMSCRRSGQHRLFIGKGFRSRPHGRTPSRGNPGDTIPELKDASTYSLAEQRHNQHENDAEYHFP